MYNSMIIVPWYFGGFLLEDSQDSVKSMASNFTHKSSKKRHKQFNIPLMLREFKWIVVKVDDDP